MENNIRSNVVVNIISTIVLTLLSFITFPWVCRCLGESQVGLYTWANTFVYYFLILAKVGLPNLAVRECVKVRDNKEQLSDKVQSFFLIQLITTLISFALMCSIIFSVQQFRDNSTLIFILSLNFLTGVFSFEWLFIALEKQFYMSVRSIITLTLSAILIITYVSNPNDLYLYAFIAILVTVFNSVINLTQLKKYIFFKIKTPLDIKPYIKPLILLCALSFGVSIYNQTDTLILGFINKEMNGVASYSVGIKGIDIIIGIFVALSTVFIPRAAYYYGLDDKKYFNNLTKYSINICLFIVLPAIVTMCLLSKEICGLICGVNYSVGTGEYQDAPYVLISLSTMMLTYSLGNIIFTQILLPGKKEKIYLFAIYLGTILNVILSLVLRLTIFTENPAIGVAIATSITDIILLIFLSIKTRDYFFKNLFTLNTLKLFLATVLILIITLVIYKPLYLLWSAIGISPFPAMMFEIISVVLIDGVVYILFLLLMKENLVFSFTKKRRQQIREEEAKYVK